MCSPNAALEYFVNYVHAQTVNNIHIYMYIDAYTCTCTYMYCTCTYMYMCIMPI